MKTEKEMAADLVESYWFGVGMGEDDAALMRRLARGICKILIHKAVKKLLEEMDNTEDDSAV